MACQFCHSDFGSSPLPITTFTPHQGLKMWHGGLGSDWGGSVDSILTLPPSASLDFMTAYSMETDYDYGYVEVSTDDGFSWSGLPTNRSATSNPSVRTSATA